MRTNKFIKAVITFLCVTMLISVIPAAAFALTGWQNVGGDDYYYDASGNYVTGAQLIKQKNASGEDEYQLYIFDTDGKLIVKVTNSGLYTTDNGIFYLDNGIALHAGLVKIGSSYYYFDSSYKAVTSQTRRINTPWNNGLLPVGEYTFGADGKIILESTKNGIYDEDGTLYYYENGVRTHKGLVKIGEDYYYIKTDCTAVTNVTRTVDENHNNGLLPAGTYTFGADGKLVIKNGIIEEDGTLYYYENGVRAHKGLIKIGDDYYYVKTDGSVVTNTTRTVDDNHNNGLLPAGTYTFGADGKMTEYNPNKTGIFDEGGVLYYYENGVKTHKGLVKIGDDYYYIKTDCTAVTNTTRTVDANHNNGLLPAGTYTFGADGKLVIKNGIIEEDGTLYYYENGVRAHKGLIKIGDDYYYVKTDGSVVTNTTRTVDANHNNGLLPAGTYTFGADGKLVIRNGIVEEGGTLYYYENGVRVHKGLVKIDNEFYYVKTDGSLVVNETRAIDSNHNNGVLPAGTYSFGPDGKMVKKNGIVTDESGNISYYVDGEPSMPIV